MNKLRMFAFAVASGCVVLIASYYLFGGPLNLSLFFPAPTFYQPPYNRIPELKPMTPGPMLSPAPRPMRALPKLPHPSMKTKTRTDDLVHMSPPPYMPVPVYLVSPPPAPTYAPVTPPPYTPTKPVITLPQSGPLPSPSAMPVPGSSPTP
ncbi:MAG TPA: hypothetical protein VII69_07895 [Candidatus Eremiobacteraceae bacterium]